MNKKDLLTLILDEIVANLDDNLDYLNHLDSQVGGGDHGTRILKGFKAVQDKLNQIDRTDLRLTLKDIGQILGKHTEGTIGQILNKGLIEASQKIKGTPELTLETVSAVGEAILTGIKSFGKAKEGESTIIDALSPALKELKLARDSNASLPIGLLRATTAAAHGVRSTKEMIALHGRIGASKEKSKGHIDPGAASGSFIFQSLAQAIIKKLAT